MIDKHFGNLYKCNILKINILLFKKIKIYSYLLLNKIIKSKRLFKNIIMYSIWIIT